MKQEDFEDIYNTCLREINNGNTKYKNWNIKNACQVTINNIEMMSYLYPNDNIDYHSLLIKFNELIKEYDRKFSYCNMI